MSRLVGLHRLAGRELHAAARYYRRRSAAAEQRFRDAIGRAFGRIANAAEQCSPYQLNYRWVKPGRFPYIIYFQITSDAEVTIYAVAHQSRRTGYWLRRVHRP
jgi:plasmid stabilization system protein ParE